MNVAKLYFIASAGPFSLSRNLFRWQFQNVGLATLKHQTMAEVCELLLFLNIAILFCFDQYVAGNASNTVATVFVQYRMHVR